MSDHQDEQQQQSEPITIIPLEVIPSVDKQVKECIKFWSSSTKTQGSEQFRSTLNYYKTYNSSYNPFTEEYQGYPSYYHLMVFFDAVEDKLGASDYYTFSTKTIKNTKDLELKEKINKMTPDELLDFMDKVKEEKLAQLRKTSSDINFRYIPGMIVQGRYMPQNAAFLLFQWLNWVETKLNECKDEEYSALIIARCNLIQKLKSLLCWKAMNGSGMDSLNEFIESGNTESPQAQSSYMKESFKPTISLPPIKFDVINKILTDAEQPTLDPTKDMQTITEYYLLLERLEKLCGIGAESFVKFRNRKRKGGYPERKDTLTAVYKTLTHKERKEQLHKSLWHFKKYNKAVNQAAKLRGRLQNVFTPFITSISTKIDKSGLATRFFTPEYYIFDDVKEILTPESKVDIPSVVFTAMAVSEFSVRKAFTIDSQQQGGLDDALQYLMNLLKGREAQTKWELIASLYPVEDVISRIDDELKTSVLSQLLTLQIQMAKFLGQQWNNGVERCCQKDMMVPRRGTTTVDTSGWNSTVGAWNNSIRFIRAICKSLGQEPPLIIKCMKLTAADQMQWAQMAGKDEPEDVPVFKKLTLDKKITPWGIVLGTINVTKEDIIKACEECKVEPKRWLGHAQERTMDTKIHCDMICGCSVPNDAVYQNLLKIMGAFGYKPPKQQQ